MDIKQIIIEIDSEIARLEQAKVLLTGIPANSKLGRLDPVGKTGKKRTMSEAARKRISEAQKKRWAAQKK
jgi:hypothetical protein